MTRFNALALAAFSFVLGILFFAFMIAAENYQTIGHGLAPWLAYPLATLCPVVIGLVWLWLSSDYEDDSRSSDDTQVFIDGLGRRHYQ